MLERIFYKIKEYDTIIIHRHIKPDGDAIGSQLGLKYAILNTFPEKKVYAVGDSVEYYDFIEPMDIIDDDIYNGALVIIVDSGSERLISDSRYKLGKYIIKIDHHIAQGEYGDMAYVDDKRESCAGIIASLIKSTPLVMDKVSAEYIYLGIVTDSGRFRYSSTTPETFEIASYLLSFGIDIGKIYNNIYTEELKTIRLRAELTLKFAITTSGIAYLKNTYEDVIKYQTTVFNISRGMINIMAGIKGVKIWVNFTEDENSNVFAEIRSNGIDINKIAVKYGGGGHLQASGATLKSFNEADLMLKDLELLLQGDKNA